MTPAAWGPYPDAEPVLAGLRARGVAVGVVSNIGWDLRPVFRAHGLDPSCRRVRPVVRTRHPEAGRAGSSRSPARSWGSRRGEVLMVGDDRTADGGAARIGCGVHFVDHLPAAERPDGLRPVLDLVGTPGRPRSS